MDRKKELKQMYKETTIEAGIYQIKNTKNQKRFIGSTKNFKTINGTKFMLKNDNHTNKELQVDWNNFGEEAFEFKVVELLKKKDNEYYDEKKELEKLEGKWLEHFQPYGERGYHKK
jgi:hypothetical protein